MTKEELKYTIQDNPNAPILFIGDQPAVWGQAVNPVSEDHIEYDRYTLPFTLSFKLGSVMKGNRRERKRQAFKLSKLWGTKISARKIKRR